MYKYIKRKVVQVNPPATVWIGIKLVITTVSSAIACVYYWVYKDTVYMYVGLTCCGGGLGRSLESAAAFCTASLTAAPPLWFPTSPFLFLLFSSVPVWGRYSYRERVRDRYTESRKI